MFNYKNQYRKHSITQIDYHFCCLEVRKIATIFSANTRSSDYSSFSGSDSDYEVNDDEFVSSSGLPDDDFEIIAEESDNDLTIA